MHFQAYLLEGLMRWNQDRARAAVSIVGRAEPPQPYSVLLRHVANKLSEEVFGQPLVPNFKGPNKYTGMYIINNNNNIIITSYTTGFACFPF